MRSSARRKNEIDERCCHFFLMILVFHLRLHTLKCVLWYPSYVCMERCDYLTVIMLIVVVIVIP